jgi:hypothetical protein
MFSAAARHLVRREGRAVAARYGGASTRMFASLEQYEDYGKNVFTGKVAEAYLSKQGASPDILKDPTWVAKHADVVAQAVFEWYVRFFWLVAGCCSSCAFGFLFCGRLFEILNLLRQTTRP